jgi:branched-chain amino acid transport system permease protein
MNGVARMLPWAAGTILVLAVLPWLLPSDYYVGIATHVIVYALFALSLNIIIGYGGMTSLGHAVYLGVPAYACAWLVANAGVGTVPAAIGALGVGTLLAACFGVLALRASGLGFLMITLALGQVVWGIAYRWVALTGGDNGLRLVARPHPFGIDISGPYSFYYFVCCVFLLALLCLWQLARSPFGACLRGTRDQPRRMRMMGHHVWAIRWAAFVLSGFWGSVAGLIYIYDFQFVSPQTLGLQQSAEALLMVVLGGAGTLAGPVAGAIIITLVKSVASSYIDRWYSLLGLIFILVVVFMPEGLVPGCCRIWARMRRPRPAVRTA